MALLWDLINFSVFSKSMDLYLDRELTWILQPMWRILLGTMFKKKCTQLSHNVNITCKLIHELNMRDQHTKR